MVAIAEDTTEPGREGVQRPTRLYEVTVGNIDQADTLSNLPDAAMQLRKLLGPQPHRLPAQMAPCRRNSEPGG
jgi:hypothetical protein